MRENSWVLVANCEKAKLFKVVKIGQLEELLDFSHPQKGLKETDVYSSPPGRNFNSPGSGGNGNGGGTKQSDTRHSYEPHTTFKDKKDILFAKAIGKHLTNAYDRNEFQSIYIFAQPHFLGVLKKHLSTNVIKATIDFISKDIVNFSPDAIWEHSEIL